jgi:hypothetical protein
VPVPSIIPAGSGLAVGMLGSEFMGSSVASPLRLALLPTYFPSSPYARPLIEFTLSVFYQSNRFPPIGHFSRFAYLASGSDSVLRVFGKINLTQGILNMQYSHTCMV